MNIRIQIERLVLDGLPVAYHQHELLQSAVETELARLLSERGLAPGLRSGGTMPSLSVPPVQLTGAPDAARLGRHIARAVYGGLGP